MVQARHLQKNSTSEIAQIRSSLSKASSRLAGATISKTPVAGIYQADMEGAQMLYVTSDGKYAFRGDMYKLGQDGAINLTGQIRKKRIADSLSKVRSEDMITFRPSQTKTKKSIYVFTDVDCGYCRKLHKEISELNKHGVEVNYLAFPRAGINSRTYNKMVSAWCSDNKKTAYSELVAGKTIKGVSCANRVADQLKLGQTLGVSGTPAIFFDDGTLLPGYKPASKIVRLMGISVEKPKLITQQ